MNDCKHCQKLIELCSCEIYKCANYPCEDLANNALAPIDGMEYCEKCHNIKTFRSAGDLDNEALEWTNSSTGPYDKKES